MKYCYLLFGLFFVSCAVNNPEYKESEEAWICHNPESERHGELCEESVHPLLGAYETCYWLNPGHHDKNSQRASDSFCWLLEKRDCSGPLEHECQRRNCHFFD